MRVDNFSGLELLGRAKKFKFSKKSKRRAVAGMLVPLPGAGFRAAASLVKARRAAKGKTGGGKKARRVSVGVAAAALIPGAGTFGLMVAAAKRRKAQAAKKKAVGLNVVPAAALPASVAVPRSVGVMNPVFPAPSYSPPPALPESYDDPTEDTYDDPTGEALEENEENEATEENEETEETEETKNFWE